MPLVETPPAARRSRVLGDKDRMPLWCAAHRRLAAIVLWLCRGKPPPAGVKSMDEAAP